MPNNQRRIFLLALFACGLVLSITATHGYAQTRPGCDPQYMDALESKSWALGQRRISQNKNLILKPDSVLEYSCFNQYIGFLASEPGTRRFSENYAVPGPVNWEYPNWGPISGIGFESLDYAFFEILSEPLLEYLVPFGHTFLGGRSPLSGFGAPPPYGTVDCQAMQTVWSMARCSQYEDQQIDAFYDFLWYSYNDPRQIPQEHSCQPVAKIADAVVESYRGRGQDGLSGNEFTQFTLLTENNPVNDGQSYEEDPILVQQIMDLILPGSCANSAVVPTGVHIEIPGQSDFDERFCTIPSCSHDGAGACIQ